MISIHLLIKYVFKNLKFLFYFLMMEIYLGGKTSVFPLLSNITFLYIDSIDLQMKENLDYMRCIKY
jgi:hypothetical protein